MVTVEEIKSVRVSDLEDMFAEWGISHMYENGKSKKELQNIAIEALCETELDISEQPDEQVCKNDETQPKDGGSKSEEPKEQSEDIEAIKSNLANIESLLLFRKKSNRKSAKVERLERTKKQLEKRLRDASKG